MSTYMTTVRTNPTYATKLHLHNSSIFAREITLKGLAQACVGIALLTANIRHGVNGPNVRSLMTALVNSVPEKELLVVDTTEENHAQEAIYKGAHANVGMRPVQSPYPDTTVANLVSVSLRLLHATVDRTACTVGYAMMREHIVNSSLTRQVV